MGSIKQESSTGAAVDTNLQVVTALHTLLKAADTLMTDSASTLCASPAMAALKGVVQLAIPELAKVAPAVELSRDGVMGLLEKMSAATEAPKLPAITDEERKQLQGAVTALEATLRSIHRERSSLELEKAAISKERSVLEQDKAAVKTQEEELLHLWAEHHKRVSPVPDSEPAIEQMEAASSTSGAGIRLGKAATAAELLASIRVEAGKLRK